jgi:hypothetical protein
VIFDEVQVQPPGHEPLDVLTAYVIFEKLLYPKFVVTVVRYCIPVFDPKADPVSSRRLLYRLIVPAVNSPKCSPYPVVLLTVLLVMYVDPGSAPTTLIPFVFPDKAPMAGVP